MGERTRELAQEMMQALLDHIRRCRRERRPGEPKLYPAGYLISYTSLIEQSGVQLPARRTSGPLNEIGKLCGLRGWPLLPALVVKLSTGQPGMGYFRIEPSEAKTMEALVEAWGQEARACIAFKGWPQLAPRLVELELADKS